MCELNRVLLVGTRLADRGGVVRAERNWIGGNRGNPVGAALVEELTNVFGQFETLWCDELRGLEIDGYEDPCYCVVETVAKKLQELLARCEEEIPHAE